MKVAIVILNYNGKAHLEHYLPSVIEHSAPHEIIVADNASTDDSVDFLKKNYPQIPLIINGANGGFAKGYNDALAKVKADYYVLLNSDVEVTSNWVDAIVERMESNPKVVAAQPKILSYTEKNKFEHAGAAGGFIDKNYYPFCRGRIFSSAEEDHGQYDSELQIFWATGACMFIRAKAFHDAGGFDADFFAHMEEIDLCWRLQNMGHEIWCYPSSTVYHLGGGTLNYMSPFKTFLNFRNNLYMIHKNHDGFVLGIILKRLVLDGIAGAKFFFGGQFKHTWAVLKAHFAYYGQIGKLNKKRKAIAGQKSQISTIRPINIVVSFFLRGKKTYSDLE